MKRVIDKQLVNWKNKKRRKPLILRGARQVGKTYSLKHFGSGQFHDTILIDFEKIPEYVTIFDTDFDIRRIIREIEILTRKKIIPGKTLLILDEVQLAPRAIMSLRYFYEEVPELHIIAAGSLIEFAFSQISVPVGRVQFMYMYPMNFYEFLLACNFNDLAKIINEKPQKLSPVIHKKLLEELKNYFFTGGMPECVKTYAETGDFIEISEVHSEIVSSYKLDFTKYTPKIDINCLTETLNEVSKSIGQQIKYSRLTSHFSVPTTKKALFLLEKARLVKTTYSVNPPDLPFSFSAKKNIFKAIFLDIGLMQHINGLDFKGEFLKAELLNIYNGALAEQFVGQEMFMAQNDELYYWSRQAKSSNAEVDFLASYHNNILGIEVKSGASGSLKSLHLLLKENPQIKEGIVFSTREYSAIPEQRLRFIPIYYAGANFTLTTP
ncbi:MAG: AAA family ATPase [Bacteroidota bacterium]